ncbi:MAG: transmembrane sensor [Saprospiraceae bacterium]|jgi:transmembrane sensor|tara:strand:- start:1888 stop:2874 length:987 start_codon:yes stop_codon:yes gene_type:complete
MDKYLQCTPIELADDDSFIRWAKNTSQEGDLDWDNWLASHTEKTSDVQTAKNIVLGIQFKEETVSQATEDKVWSKINEKISTDINSSQKKSTKKASIFKLISYGAVAAIALVLLMMNIGSGYDTSVQTPYAMSKSIQLPDGSTVQMNADSKLEYDTKSWDKNRHVSLEGEAFFSVQKGSKFTVKTKYGNVQVLGTSFNVNTRNQILNVICKTGKVAVSNSQNETILTPNQSVSIVSQIHKFNNNTPRIEDRSSWIKGSYTYSNESLSNVILDLERQYDIKISIAKNLSTIKYSGGFVNGNIDNSLSEVMWPLGLKFTTNGKNVIITKE